MYGICKLWHINLNGITSNCIRSKLIKMGIWYTIMIKILNDIVLLQNISNITLHNVIASAVDIVGKINMQIWYQIRLSYNMSKSFTSHRREASFAWRLEGCSFANKSVSNQRHFPMYRNSSPHCATPTAVAASRSLHSPGQLGCLCNGEKWSANRRSVPRA